MIGWLGEITLAFALVFALMQGILPLVGFLRQNIYLSAFARPSAIAQFIFVLMSYILLTIAFGISDMSLDYVAANSHPLLPIMYRLTAVWGGHEGSILLWIFILNSWTMVFAITQKNNTNLSLTLAILGLINACFLGFLLFTSNPFLSSGILQKGQDLNPLLQDPGFVIHPPMLYTGYVGFAVAFAITQAAIIRGKLSAEWAAVTRTFAIAAWCFLTFGIMLGSWWAYRVLGWGGFWFWDPVENASLLPWIAGTALIHVLILAEKKQTAINWAALLAILTFALSLLGTFLVRSGVLISAHTFANDPARGTYLLILLAIILTMALAVYVFRMPKISPRTIFTFAFLSRETSLLINSGLLMIAMLTILLGTIYPLIIDALHLGVISVGAPYFNLVMAPLVFMVMLFMGIAPFCKWQEMSWSALGKLLWKNCVISIVSAIFLLWYFVGHVNGTAFLSISLSFWILLSVLPSIKTLPAMSLAHTGFAIMIIGIMLSSVLNQEREVRIKPGDAVTVGPYQFFFIDTVGVSDSNYRGIRGEFEVLKGTRHIINLYPEKRIYTVREMVMTKVDIHPGLFRDLYIALGEPFDHDVWSVRIYYKPYIRFIWLGGIIMILGGLLAIIKGNSRAQSLAGDYK